MSRAATLVITTELVPLFAIILPSEASHLRLSMSSNQTPPPRSFISLNLATTSCMFARGEVLAHGSTRPTRSGQRNQVESETQPTETFMLKPFRDTSNRAILDSRQIVHSCVRHHFLLEEATSQDQATSSEELLRSAISFKASSGIPSPLQSVAARNGLLGPHHGTEAALFAQSCQDMATQQRLELVSWLRKVVGHGLSSQRVGGDNLTRLNLIFSFFPPPPDQGSWG